MSNDIIQDVLDKIDGQRQKVIRLGVPVDLCYKAIELFPDIDLQSPSIDWRYDCVVKFSAFVDRYSDMGPLFEYFDDNGWHKYTDSDIGNGPRSYHYWWFVPDLDSPDQIIEVQASFRDTETACKWSQVGTRQIPVYEIVCPDGSKGGESEK